MLWHVITSCEALHEIRGVQDLPQTPSYGGSSCLQSVLHTDVFPETCKILPHPVPSEGSKLHIHFGEEMVSGGSFQLGFWFASKLAQPLKIKESLHEIVFYRTPFEHPQIIIIIILYFVNPFLTLSSISALSQALLFTPSFSPLLQVEIPPSRICTVVMTLHFREMAISHLMPCLPCESWSPLPAHTEMCPESIKCSYEHLQSIWESPCIRGCVFRDMRWL